MKRTLKTLILTIALLFSTPAWALTPGCDFYRGKWKVSEIKDSIKLNDCEHVRFKTTLSSRITKICRFDREIVFEQPKDAFSIGYTLCVPKK